MKSKYVLHSSLYKEEYEYPLKIDDKKAIVPIGSILVFKKTVNVDCHDICIDAMMVFKYSYECKKVNDTWKYYKIVLFKPLLSYVHCLFV